MLKYTCNIIMILVGFVHHDTLFMLYYVALFHEDPFVEEVNSILFVTLDLY
jgi:hypothetical protein